MEKRQTHITPLHLKERHHHPLNQMYQWMKEMMKITHGLINWENGQEEFGIKLHTHNRLLFNVMFI